MRKMKSCPFCGESERLAIFPKDPRLGVSQQIRRAKCNSLATLSAWAKQGAYAELLSDLDKEIKNDCGFKRFKRSFLKRRLVGKCLS